MKSYKSTLIYRDHALFKNKLWLPRSLEITYYPWCVSYVCIYFYIQLLLSNLLYVYIISLHLSSLRTKGGLCIQLTHCFNLVGASLKLFQLPTIHSQLFYETYLESWRFRVISKLRKKKKTIRLGKERGMRTKGPKATDVKILPSLSIYLFSAPLNLYARGYGENTFFYWRIQKWYLNIAYT